MLYGIGLSGTGGQIDRARMENLSNNLANIDTAGFKQDILTLMQRPTESNTVLTPGQAERLFYQDELLDPLGGGVWLNQTYRAHDVGAHEHTGNSLDFALSGKGFFTMLEPQTQLPYYTRAGNFKLNDQGELVSVDGSHFVLDDKGEKINLGGILQSNGGVDFTVAPEGQIEIVMGDGSTIASGARLGITIFDDQDAQKLEKIGATLFGAPDQATRDRSIGLQDLSQEQRNQYKTYIRQGYLEVSDADPLLLMKEMVEINRSFERNMNMMMLQNGTLEQLISGVARS